MGYDGDRVRVIEHPDADMLFSGANAGLLFSVYPTVERDREPNEIELTVRTGYVKGECDGPDWGHLAQKIKESGMNMTVRVLLRPDDVDDFFVEIPSEMARRGECRRAEFLLGDEVIADYLSSGDQWEFQRWGLFQ